MLLIKKVSFIFTMISHGKGKNLRLWLWDIQYINKIKRSWFNKWNQNIRTPFITKEDGRKKSFFLNSFKNKINGNRLKLTFNNKFFDNKNSHSNSSSKKNGIIQKHKISFELYLLNSTESNDKIIF